MPPLLVGGGVVVLEHAAINSEPATATVVVRQR